jgi:peptide/nickel transport system ATP-binding protein
MGAPPLLEGERLHRTFAGREPIHALVDVSIAVAEGEALGIVGESGSGKTTLARILVGLDRPDAGVVRLGGRAVDARRRHDRRALQSTMQMVFQDSAGSLNPRLTALEAVAFGLRARGLGRRQAREGAAEALEDVGLPASDFGRAFPHELSGGQRQRVNLARAVALRPRLLVLDEPVSALDKSVEAQVLNLLVALQSRLALTLVMISHDLAVVRYLCGRVAVMRHGAIVETGATAKVFAHPVHDYTRLLLDASPGATRRPASAPPAAAAISA